MSEAVARVGAVVIGRNEGARLVRCLDSLLRELPAARVVYVDSGSTDASVAEARARGATVLALDLATPFTAARARNAGFARLEEVAPAVELVQFVDGDCELQPGWLEHAAAFLRAHPEVAIACGRRRERRPEASPYNRLADMEWNTPIGDAAGCGGDALVRAAAFRAVGGYDATLIAGEEPEMCLRLRRAGQRIHRLDHEMTLHDADMQRFGQFWRRARRAGHAYAEAAFRHGAGPERFGVRPVVSAAFWALAPPLAALALAPRSRIAALLALASWAWPLWRGARAARARGHSAADARLYAFGVWIAKFAELTGALEFLWNHGLRGRATRLIEYK